MYHAMAATPLMPLDILIGHLLWIATRIAMASGVYLAVVAVFGGVRSPLALRGIARPACSSGMAFAGPIVAFSSQSRDTTVAFAALNRFAIVPMFLFSGTFFPVSQLPEVLRWIAYATPLWHGVELVRSLTLGHLRCRSRHSATSPISRVWAAVGIGLALRHIPPQAGRVRWQL